jgi:endoglucanase
MTHAAGNKRKKPMTQSSPLHAALPLRPRQRLLTALPAVLLALACTAGTALAAPPGTLTFGVYDPDGAFSDDPEVSIEHVFLPWEGVDLDTLRAADAYAAQRDRRLLVTIEPWIWGVRPRPEDLRQDILSGGYDATMRSVCAVIGELESPVLVRWAHEMENPNGHFPWAMWEPADYIEAYRRMIGVCRTVAPDARFMWSPGGEEGTQAYYPGEDVVDLVGLSIFGAQEYDVEVFGAPQSFAETLEPRYDRVVGFGKEIVVAELGYVGESAYLEEWHTSVREPDDRFSELASVIYFAQQEVWPWPNDFGLPDWREGVALNN